MEDDVYFFHVEGVEIEEKISVHQIGKASKSFNLTLTME
jgi:hypothetical protein